MAVTEIHPTRGADDYVDGNSELFERRKALQTQLAEMQENGADQRRTTRIRRSLDDVTAEIVQFNLGLVRSYCKRFTANSSREDSADFEAAGLLGLMRAIDSFDPSQGRFGAWAFKPIQREVLRAVRDADHPNVNLGDFERRPEILRAFRHLQGDDTRYVPSYAEVAAVVVTAAVDAAADVQVDLADVVLQVQVLVALGDLGGHRDGARVRQRAPMHRADPTPPSGLDAARRAVHRRPKRTRLQQGQAMGGGEQLLARS